ncbi:MAG: hypothetical protein M3463_09845 [Verrucomicrobiota bacterium]|nr:hypothetical protein [Verrucomicrobiota bacterium]
MKCLPASIAVATALIAGFTSAVGIDFPAVVAPEVPRTFPFSMVGQLLFRSGRSYYSGSGTVIGAHSVLTAAHNLYDPVEGWSTRLVFKRGLHGGSALSSQPARRLYVLAGYNTSSLTYGGDSVQAFSHDTGGLVFDSPVADGAAAAWVVDATLLTSPAPKVAFGYGGERHSGEDLLASYAGQFSQVSGGFFEALMNVEPGMSGGPVIAQKASGELAVCAVVVSSSADPVLGGVRVIAPNVERFIQRYLP